MNVMNSTDWQLFSDRQFRSDTEEDMDTSLCIGREFASYGELKKIIGGKGRAGGWKVEDIKL